MSSENTKTTWWEPRSLPTGIWTPPSWLRSAHVDMNEAFPNSPRVLLKTFGSPWPEPEQQRWHDAGGGAWTTISPCGHVMERLFHPGKITPTVTWRILADGVVATRPLPDGWMVPTVNPGERDQDAAMREARYHQERMQTFKQWAYPVELTIETQRVLVTTKQEGFAGSHFQITLESGEILILRGPWHGVPPSGWEDCAVYNVKDWDSTKRFFAKKIRPWWQGGMGVGSFGCFYSSELILRAVARWQPHVQVALVSPGYGKPRLEFYDAAWGAPKQFAETRKPGWGPKS